MLYGNEDSSTARKLVSRWPMGIYSRIIVSTFWRNYYNRLRASRLKSRCILSSKTNPKE